MYEHMSKGFAKSTGAPVAQRTPPLQDLVIADFSRVLSGPLATMLLGDFGATVVKVERPGEGDESRAWGPPFIGEASAYYAAVNRNKQSVALDLNDPDDRHLAHSLAAYADVVVENFRPGTMEKFGLGYEDLAPTNPGLIYCGISGFGRGEGAHFAGYDFLIQAMGGLMSITGQPDGEPTKVGVALVDVLAGLFATVGVLAALAERQRSGLGQRIDLNLLSTLLASLVNQGSGFLATGKSAPRMGNGHPSVAPYELYLAADGEIVIAVGNERQFARLAGAIGRPGLTADARFATNALRVQHRQALRQELESALELAGVALWVERLRAVGVPCGQVNDIARAFDLAGEIGLAPVFEMMDATGSTIPQVRNPLVLSDTPVGYRLAPPRLGEHTDRFAELIDILRDRKYSDTSP
jgi:crotonobetainyl-CoA:carnitine CoA-transferase CaiB-like acyl-CoA transferase